MRMIRSIATLRDEVTVMLHHIEVIVVDNSVDFRLCPVSRFRNTQIDRLPFEGFRLPIRRRVCDHPVVHLGISNVQGSNSGIERCLGPIDPQPKLQSLAMCFVGDRSEAIWKFLGIRIPVANAAEPAGVNMKHFELQIRRIAQHLVGELLVDRHATAPTIVDEHRIVGVFPSLGARKNLTNPATQSVSGNIDTSSSASQKHGGRQQGFARLYSGLEWSGIRIQSRVRKERTFFAD